jgi:sugar/nucleoside kinase (ribokinase family)
LSVKKLDVIVAGDIFVDMIMSGFPEWPKPGAEAFATDLRREIGGGAAITACGLAKLGSRTGVLGVLGYDSQWVLDRFKSRGVGTSDLRIDRTDSTACAVAISTPEDRTFLTYPGANRGFPELLAQVAGAGQLAHARHVHLGWAPKLETAAELVAAIHANECTVSLDVGWHEHWLADPRAMALLRLIDIFFPNEVESLRMTGEAEPERALRCFEAAGVRRVALKLGGNGAMLLWDGAIFTAQPFSVTPVDTVGAGDCFDAGFLYFWLNGATPEASLRAGNFCGAASTEGYGGIDGFPDLTRVAQALRD